MFIAGNKYAEMNNLYPDIIMFLSLHAINRKSEHIDNALNVLRITEVIVLFPFKRKQNQCLIWKKMV